MSQGHGQDSAQLAHGSPQCWRQRAAGDGAVKEQSWGESSWVPGHRASLQSDRLHPQGTQMRVLGSPDTPRLGLNNAADLVISVNTRPALATHQMPCLTAWPRRWLVLVNRPCRPERMCYAVKELSFLHNMLLVFQHACCLKGPYTD